MRIEVLYDGSELFSDSSPWPTCQCILNAFFLQLLSSLRWCRINPGRGCHRSGSRDVGPFWFGSLPWICGIPVDRTISGRNSVKWGTREVVWVDCILQSLRLPGIRFMDSLL